MSESLAAFSRISDSFSSSSPSNPLIPVFIMPTSKKLHVTLLYIYEYAELSDSLFFEAGIDLLSLYKGEFIIEEFINLA